MSRQFCLRGLSISLLLVVSCMTSFSYADAWGAIYMDVNTGIAGASYNYGDSVTASRMAEVSCRKKHGNRQNNCRYVASFKNSCGAVYWSPINKKSGWAWDGVNEYRAQMSARKACGAAGGVRCQLRVSACNVIYY